MYCGGREEAQNEFTLQCVYSNILRRWKDVNETFVLKLFLDSSSIANAGMGLRNLIVAQSSFTCGGGCNCLGMIECLCSFLRKLTRKSHLRGEEISIRMESQHHLTLHKQKPNYRKRNDARGTIHAHWSALTAESLFNCFALDLHMSWIPMWHQCIKLIIMKTKGSFPRLSAW